MNEYNFDELLLPSSNEKNLRNLIDLVQNHFYFDVESEKEIIEELYRNLDGVYCNPLNLPLDSQGRMWIEVPLRYKQAYSRYNHLLEEKLWKTFEDVSFYGGDQKKLEDERQLISELLNPQVFLDGRYKEQKLYKLILKKGLLSSDDVEVITTINDAGDGGLMCISKNPVDMLMASSNQSFKSCLNLESTYNDAYYMGLPVTFVDASRYIIFHTSGKFRKALIKDIQLKHFGYQSRAWAIATDEEELAILKSYPSTKIEFHKALQSVNIPAFLDDTHREASKPYRSIEKYKVLQDVRGNDRAIYHDSGTDYKGYYCNGPVAGHLGDSSYDWEGGFENLFYPEQLWGEVEGEDGQQWYYCYHCDRRFTEAEREEQGHVDPHGNYWCEDCFQDLFTACDHCGEYVQSENIVNCITDDLDYCEGCREELLVSCARCGAWILGSSKDYESDRGETYCSQRCAERDNEGVCDICCHFYTDNDEDNVGERICDECR